MAGPRRWSRITCLIVLLLAGACSGDDSAVVDESTSASTQASTVPSTAAEDRYLIADGIGPISVGMEVDEAEAELPTGWTMERDVTISAEGEVGAVVSGGDGEVLVAHYLPTAGGGDRRIHAVSTSDARFRAEYGVGPGCRSPTPS